MRLDLSSAGDIRVVSYDRFGIYKKLTYVNNFTNREKTVLVWHELFCAQLLYFYKHMTVKYIKPLLFKNKHIKSAERKISA